MIWALYAWIPEDEAADPGDNLASRSNPPASIQKEPPRGFPTMNNGYCGGRGAEQSMEWRATPSYREPAWDTAGVAPGTLQTSPGNGMDSSQLGGYRFRPLNKDDKRRSKPSRSVYPAREYDHVAPVYGNEPGRPRYGVGDQITNQQGPPLKFRPLTKSQRAQRRWTGNYPSPGRGYTTESYGQWAVPRDFDRSTPQSLMPPQGNPMLFYDRLGVQDVYSAR